jgi:hypothetical protein
VEARDDPQAELGQGDGHRQAEEHGESVLHQRSARRPLLWGAIPKQHRHNYP